MASKGPPELGIPSLAAKETDSTQSKVSKLEMPVLIDEKIVWFEVTRNLVRNSAPR